MKLDGKGYLVRRSLNPSETSKNWHLVSESQEGNGVVSGSLYLGKLKIGAKYIGKKVRVKINIDILEEEKWN